MKWEVWIKWGVYFLCFLLVLIAVGWILKEGFVRLVKTEEKVRERIRRGLLVLISILIGISVATFNPTDYSNLELLSFTLKERISNQGGVVGAIIGLWLRKGGGIVSFVIPLLLFIWGVVPGRYYNILKTKTLVIIGWSILGMFVLGEIGEEGGILGEKLVYFGEKYFGIGRWFIVGTIGVGLIFSVEKIRKMRFKKKEVKEKKKEKIPPPIEEKEVVEGQKEEPPPLVLLSKEEKEPLADFNFPQFRVRFLEKLASPPIQKVEERGETLKERASLLEHKFEEFGISGKITRIAPGPVITRYEYEPAPGVKISQVANLSDDIAMSMKSSRVRIVAPIPGKAVIGIEIPNPKPQPVYLKELLSEKGFEEFDTKLGVVIGKDIAGTPVWDDISRFPHLLIAGTTGSGKSVCINTIIASILYKATPKEVRFVMIDPKRLELRIYNTIPHLIKPAISDAKEALETLKKAIWWMETRYKEFAKVGVRDIEGYNKKIFPPKPYILIIIDELADLMLTAPKDIEAILTRLAQMSRAVGIHLVLATQRPSVDIITGLIKANFPARIAFQVASKTDSRTILDMNGAEKLLGKGDMLFLSPGQGTPERLHGSFIDTQESKGIAELWSEVWLNKLFTGKIQNVEKLVPKMIEEEIVEVLVEKDRIPGWKERIERFAQKISKEIEVLSQELIELLLTLEYYPPLEEELMPEKEVYPTMEVKEKEEVSSEEEEEGEDELFEEAKALVIRYQTASVSLFQRHFKIGYARAGRLIDQLEKKGIIGPYVGSKSRKVLIPREEERGK